MQSYSTDIEVNITKCSRIHYSFEKDHLQVTYYLAEEEKSSSKEVVMNILRETKTLNSLENFDEKFSQLEKKFLASFSERVQKKQAQEQLYYLKKKYPYLYKFVWVMNWGALITTIGYLPLVVEQGPRGLEEIFILINPNIKLPSSVYAAIAIPLGSIETLMYAFTFKPDTEGVRLLKQYDEQRPIQDVLSQSFTFFKDRPRAAGKALGVVLFHASVMTLYNIAGSWTEVVGIYPYIPSYLVYPATALFTFFGSWYMMLFMNDEYKHGREFWKSDKPSLYQFLKKVKVPQVVEPGLNALVSLGMSGYPFYFFVNRTTLLYLGAGSTVATTIAAALTPVIVYHRSRSIYPSIYGYAQNPEEELQAYIGLTLDWKEVKQRVWQKCHEEKGSDLDVVAKKTITEMIDTRAEQLKKNVLTVQGFDKISRRIKLLSKSPLSCAILMYRFASCISLLSDPTPANFGLSALFFGLSLTGYNFEISRAQAVEACKVPKEELKQKEEKEIMLASLPSEKKEDQPITRCCLNTAKATSYGCAVPGTNSEALTLLGTLISLLLAFGGSSSTGLLLCFTLIVLQSGLVKARFMQPMLQNTFSLFCRKKPTQISTEESVLSNQNQQNPIEIVIDKDVAAAKPS